MGGDNPYVIGSECFVCQALLCDCCRDDEGVGDLAKIFYLFKFARL